MKMRSDDPIGQAILDYAVQRHDETITVHSDLCEDDTISVDYLFRSFDRMPLIEKKALELCRGKVLDVGAGAGVHATRLKEQGLEVECIETSPGAVQYIAQLGVSVEHVNFFHFEREKEFDTLLMLMNGIGIAGKLSNLEATLYQAKRMLKKGGRIVCDSSDIRYLYEAEDGGFWIDLNAEYYGNFQYKMSYKEQSSPWFDWLYVDFDNLKQIAEKLNFVVSKHAQENNAYLAELTLNEQ